VDEEAVFESLDTRGWGQRLNGVCVGDELRTEQRKKTEHEGAGHAVGP
jgi:hypothetical protein